MHRPSSWSRISSYKVAKIQLVPKRWRKCSVMISLLLIFCHFFEMFQSFSREREATFIIQVKPTCYFIDNRDEARNSKYWTSFLCGRGGRFNEIQCLFTSSCDKMHYMSSSDLFTTCLHQVFSLTVQSQYLLY